MKSVLNRWVRGYLAHFPVTEGKKGLLRLTKALITPADPRQTVRTKHGFSLQLNLANPEHQRIYFYGEHDERYETSLLKAVLRRGMVCWDIGANIGYYTCLLGQAVGATGRVIAFEPARETRERLAHNVSLNQLGNVEVSPLALGGAEGVARIHYRDAGLFEGTASLHGLQGQAASEKVQVATLDSLAARFGAPDFLKIDVEGAQLEVWRGGRTFFSSRQPLVMAELRDSADPAALASLEATVRGYGYRIFSIHKGCRVSESPRLSAGGPRNYMLAKAGSDEERRLRALSA